MAHARITLDYAVELITARIENGQGSPTDQEIADYCGLQQANDSRSLLADVADAGRITIRGTGAERVITLGRKAAEFVPAPRPIPSIVSRNASEGSAPGSVGMASRIDEIREIAARFSAAAAHVKPVSLPRVHPFAGPTKGRGVEHRGNAPAASQPDSPPAIPPGDGGEGARHCGPLSDDAAPQAVETLPDAVVSQLSKAARRGVPGTPEHAAHERDRAIVSAYVRGDKLGEIAKLFNVSLQRIEQIARRHGAPRRHHSRQLAPIGESAAPPAKVRVPAHITAAAQREGVPVIAFVAELLERGFSAWQGEWSVERCA